MKIAYFGFDLFFDCLEYLADSHQVIKIFTCKVDGEYEKNERTYALARKKSIPITEEKINAQMIKDLENSGCELIVSAGYYYRIPVSKIIKSINIHPSLLPEGRGPWPLPIIILKGIKTSGITAHRIAEGFDSGEIIHQSEIPVADDENLETLTCKMQAGARKIIEEVIDDLEYFWKDKKPQDGGSYWKEPSVKDMSFTLDTPYETVDKITRGFYGYACYLSVDDKVLEISEAKCVRNKTEIPIGTVKVFELNGGYLCILKLS